MTKKIQWEKMFDQFLNKAKTEREGIFSDFFNPHRTPCLGETEELISSIENGIGKMHSNANEFKEAWEHLRNDYPDLMDETS